MDKSNHFKAKILKRTLLQNKSILKIKHKIFKMNLIKNEEYFWGYARKNFSFAKKTTK